MKKSCEFWCLSTEKYFVRTQKNTDPGPRQSQEAIFYWGYFPLFILNEYIKVRFLFFILFQKVHYLVFSICGVSLVRGSLSRFNFGTNLLKKKKKSSNHDWNKQNFYTHKSMTERKISSKITCINARSNQVGGSRFKFIHP